MKILFEVAFIAFFTSPFLAAALYLLYLVIDEKLNKRRAKANGPKQHLMFSQLKKGDFVWEVTGDKIRTLFVKGVDFIYGGRNSVSSIHVNFYNDSDYLYIPAKNSKSFLHGKYHTIMGDAEATRRLNEIKRKKEVENLTTATIEEVKAQADIVIKNIERLKIACL